MRRQRYSSKDDKMFYNGNTNRYEFRDPHDWLAWQDRHPNYQRFYQLYIEQCQTCGYFQAYRCMKHKKYTYHYDRFYPWHVKYISFMPTPIPEMIKQYYHTMENPCYFDFVINEEDRPGRTMLLPNDQTILM